FWGWPRYLAAPVDLRVENVPLVEVLHPASQRHSRWSTNNQPPILTVRDRRGRISRALDGEELRVTGFDGADSVVLDPAPRVENGTVHATSMRAWGGDAVVDDSLVARFAVGDLEAPAITVLRGWNH